MEREKTMLQLAEEDGHRECMHAIVKAHGLQNYLDQREIQHEIKRKNAMRKARRRSNKSPITESILQYVQQAAKKKSKKLVLSLLEVATFCHAHDCECSLCDCLRHMRAAAAGAGHILKRTHQVSFDEYAQTITLKAA